MTTLREAAQQALEALQIGDAWHPTTLAAIKALKAALAESPTWVCPDSAEHRYQKPGHCEDCGKTLVQVAEPPDSTKPVAESEPVAWRYKYSDGFWRFSNGERVNGCDPIESQALYTAPPQRKPLTEEQIDELIKMNFGYIIAWQGPFVRAIERAHGIGGQDE